MPKSASPAIEHTDSTRRAFLRAMSAATAAAAIPGAWAQSAPKFGSSPVALGVIDIAGNLALTQKIFDAYAAANANRVSRFTFTRSPAPELAGKIRAMQAANRVELHVVLTGLDGMAAGAEQGIWQDLTPYRSILGNPAEL